jgi:hypothetical protein
MPKPVSYVDGHTETHTRVFINESERKRIAIEAIEHVTGIGPDHTIRNRRLFRIETVRSPEHTPAVWQTIEVNLRPATTQDEAAVLMIEAIRNY